MLLESAAQVVVPSRTPTRLSPDLSERPGLHLVEADIGTAEGVRAVEAFGHPFDAVVASLGGWKQDGPLTELSDDAWERSLVDNLTSHFRAARAFLRPMMEAGRGSYLMINGGAALAPVPGAGPMSILSAGQAMMTRVLAAEAEGTGVRVNALVLNTPIVTHRRPAGRRGWLQAADVGRTASFLVSPNGSAVHGAVWTMEAKPTRSKEIT